MKENPLAKGPHPTYKDVVVIGNGPSGLSMSYVLSGHTPVYNGGTHSDPMLDVALRNILQKHTSFTDTNLSSLAQVLERRTNSTPLGLLMDQLVRPGADSGAYLPSLVDWVASSKTPFSHVVIGKGPPGGTWKKMDSRTVTLSLSSWMELPGLPLHKSDAGRKYGLTEQGTRVPTSTVSEYYQEYVYKMGLQKYQRRGVVLSITEYDEAEDSESDNKINWIVEGKDSYGRKFRYHSKYVVLACGTNDSPNSLGVPGENLPWVHHSTRDLDEYLRNYNPVEEDAPVLVIGSGLSSSDGVLNARSHHFPVLHLYRGKSGLSRWLPLTSYPEYLEVHELMTGSKTCANYEGSGRLRLTEISEDADGNKRVTLTAPDNSLQTVRVAAVAILVGSTADLSFLPRDDLGVGKGPVDSRTNPLDISFSTYELNRLPNSFAIGPIAGDMFVRHILGGVVAASARMLKTS